MHNLIWQSLRDINDSCIAVPLPRPTESSTKLFGNLPESLHSQIRGALTMFFNLRFRKSGLNLFFVSKLVVPTL